MPIYDNEVMREIPPAAYSRLVEIPEADRCSMCSGLGWVLIKHTSTYNEYGGCSSCGGTGENSVSRKRQEIMGYFSGF